jgi:pyrimidine-nucleoside phosphorylase
LRPYDLIRKKRDAEALTAQEIRSLVAAVTDGAMPDYQVAAWLMAAYLRGLNADETLALTHAMRDSGDVVDWGDVDGFKLDKHSSGGVGDKTTLVVVPLLAACGVRMLKMSGRGLGFSGGTVDKLESIPGFRSNLSVREAREQVKRIGAALLGQSPALVPADKKLYALRDVTATIESIPLIAASIMSKKLAGGADAVLLDVKVGRGAFIKTLDEARLLAKTLVQIGNGSGVRTVAALTTMDEPLGYAVGNAVEVAEACRTLTGRGRVDERFLELCLVLASRGLVLAGKAEDDLTARSILEKALSSGDAANKLAEIIEAQGGDLGVVANPDSLRLHKTVLRARATKDGVVETIDAEAIGVLGVDLGAGRVHKEDGIDPAVGIVLNKKTGDDVRAGDILADIYVRDEKEAAARTAVDRVKEAYRIGGTPNLRPVIYEFVED